MSNRQYVFIWQVAGNGHEWLDGSLFKGGDVAETATRVLVRKQPGREIKHHYYKPLRQETALFRQFANLPVDETAIVEFADRFGLLTGSDEVVSKKGPVSSKLTGKSGRRFFVRGGDTRESIIDHILRLKTCVTLWEKVLANDKPFLDSVIVFGVDDAPWSADANTNSLDPVHTMGQWGSASVRFSETGVIVPAGDYSSDVSGSKIAGRNRGKHDPFGQLGTGHISETMELEPSASFYIGERIAYGFFPEPCEGHEIRGFGMTLPLHSIDWRNSIALAQALITTEITRNLSRGLLPVIQPHGNIGWGELRFVPRCLIDAIWLQFAEAVCGNKNYRQCLVCGKPFELSPDTARTSRLFCSDSCKMHSYRQRKTKTANLWDQGVSVQEIAEAVGSDEAYVHKWVARHLVARGATKREVSEKLGISVSQVTKLLAKKKGEKR